MKGELVRAGGEYFLGEGLEGNTEGEGRKKDKYHSVCLKRHREFYFDLQLYT